MILSTGVGCSDSRRSSTFLFGSFSFARCCGNVDNSMHSSAYIPFFPCGMMRREAELLTTEGLRKPVPKMSPASLPSGLPLKTVDYLGPEPELRKGGQATLLSTGRV